MYVCVCARVCGFAFVTQKCTLSSAWFCARNGRSWVHGNPVAEPPGGGFRILGFSGLRFMVWGFGFRDPSGSWSADTVSEDVCLAPVAGLRTSRSDRAAGRPASSDILSLVV